MIFPRGVYMARTLSKIALIKSLIIGILKGLLYFILVFIIVKWLITSYLIPLMIGKYGMDFGNSISIDYSILLFFILFSVFSELLNKHVPYGRAFSKLFIIMYTYIILTSISEQEFRLTSEYSELKLNILPLVNTLLYLTIVFSVANMLHILSREYKNKKKDY